MIDYDLIGQRIRAARKGLEITQEQLAELTEFTESHICHIENGKTKLSLSAIVTIANALYVSVDELLYDNLDKKEIILQQEMMEVLKDCTNAEYKTIIAVVRSLRTSYRENLK